MNETNSEFWWSLLKEEGLGMGKVLLGQALTGILIGIAAAIAVYIAYRMLSLLPKSGGGARKLLTLTWLLLLLPCAFAFIGFHKGLVKSVRHLTTEGRFAEEVMPGAAAGISEVVFLLDTRMAEVLEMEVDPDRETLNVTAFLDHKSKVEDKMIQSVLPGIAAQVKSSHRLLQAGAGAKLIDWFTDRFGEALVRDQLAKTADKLGMQSPIAAWLEGLPEAAKATGAPDDLSRKELAGYTVESLLTAFLLQPIELAIRIQNTLGYGAVAVIILVPVPLLIWVGRRDRAPGAQPA